MTVRTPQQSDPARAVTPRAANDGGDPAVSGDDLLQLAEIAQLYYERDLTQEQIARQLDVSRSHVSRMLKEAREQGVVEIRVHHPLQTIPALEARLCSRFGLGDCLVLATPRLLPDDDAPAETARRIGALAARFVHERLPANGVIGVGWGNTVYQVVQSGYLHRKAGVAVAQVMGSVGSAAPDLDGAHICARLGRIFGGRAHYLHAPMVVTDALVRNGLLRDQHIRKTLETARRATMLLMSVGAIGPVSGLYRAGYLNDADLEYIQGHGAVGDMAGTYYGRDGSVRHLELNDRMIAIGEEALRGVPIRLGVSWGEAKGLANLGACRSGLINALVTDEAAANEMLRLAAADGLPDLILGPDPAPARR